MALALLKAKMIRVEEEKREAEFAKVYDEKGEISFGSQIRSYVLQPYQLVKDLRTGHEVGQPPRGARRRPRRLHRGLPAHEAGQGGGEEGVSRGALPEIIEIESGEGRRSIVTPSLRLTFHWDGDRWSHRLEDNAAPVAVLPGPLDRGGTGRRRPGADRQPRLPASRLPAGSRRRPGAARRAGGGTPRLGRLHGPGGGRGRHRRGGCRQPMPVVGVGPVLRVRRRRGAGRPQGRRPRPDRLGARGARGRSARLRVGDASRSPGPPDPGGVRSTRDPRPGRRDRGRGSGHPAPRLSLAMDRLPAPGRAGGIPVRRDSPTHPGNAEEARWIS